MSNDIYIVYETTNLINGKFYIGVHKVNGKKWYLGSGKLLNLSIKKYGRNNFMRETLKEFNKEQDAYDYEQLIVNNKLTINNNCYNLMDGGGEGRHHNQETCKKISINNIKRFKNRENHPMYGRKHSLEARKKMRTDRKDISGSNNHFYGKTHNDITRNKISKNRKGKMLGKYHPNSKKWFIFGKLFYSSLEAGNCMNVNRRTIEEWCKRNIPLCYSVAK